MGLSFLISNHTLVHIIRDTYHISHTSPQSMKSVPILHPTRHLDRMYRFVIIEHQRSWLGNWTTLLLPNERPEWSDEYLQKTPSIHSFKLPPPVIKKGIRFAWHWASQDWEIDLNRNVDKEGWEYGSWDWKSWASKSSLSLFTRRRYWIRYARLEQLIVHDTRPISIQSTTSHTMDDTLSCSSSVTSFDSLPSTPPNTITYLHKKKSSSTSAASVNSYSPVEPYFSNDHIWLHR
ncbi:hypothetical protein G6F70_007876 [Rhizopus microsporus]|nr:hypothetical protein G6F71_007866 [Rhizopus microsporus]KAG1195907.1 hypothetical protein G6F70_007876 [Rhizopus microsporus]KAG1207693.1 hypothetical protein G6F69_007841 [Rhizopus microsporus]KAG1228596.1 hypothetical protein G6F67_007722 [Rhizopus microsporus]KAG1260526.1 hypothetical protein G6F68_007386 [Rhizopus microsporus]